LISEKWRGNIFPPLKRPKSALRPRVYIKKLTSEVKQKTELKKIVRSVEAEKEGWKENIEPMPKALAQIKR
jgi:hypothetical protein